jgi:hypothetical protein
LRSLYDGEWRLGAGARSLTRFQWIPISGVARGSEGRAPIPWESAKTFYYRCWSARRCSRGTWRAPASWPAPAAVVEEKRGKMGCASQERTLRARLVDRRGALVGFCDVPWTCSSSQSGQVLEVGLSCLPEVIHLHDGEYPAGNGLQDICSRCSQRACSRAFHALLH